MAYKNAIMVPDENLVKSFARCLELGAIPTVHAENGELVYQLQQEILKRGITGPEGHPLSRPPEVEGEAANRAIQIAKCSARRSTSSTTPARNRSRRSPAPGSTVSASMAKCSPATADRRLGVSPPRLGLRGGARDEPAVPPQGAPGGAVEGLQAGKLQTTATDHCCFCAAEGDGRNDFTKIPNGTGGVEDRMGVLWHHGVGTGSLTPNEFVR